MAGREVTTWEEREFAQNRYPVFFGSDRPKTISAKEISDNAIDQIADKKAKNVVITLDENSVEAFDDGKGISLKVDEKSGKTHLYLAVAKLYTSTNYEGVSSTVGTNGVGSTATNFLSSEFIVGSLYESSEGKPKIKGYSFLGGIHANEGQKIDKIDLDNSPFDKGFYVKAVYDKAILADDIDVPRLVKYIQSRVGELPDGAVVVVKTPTDSYIFDKIADSPNYVNSWLESVNSIPEVSVIKQGAWKFAFSKETPFTCSSIIQGAPISNNQSFNAKFDIEGKAVTVPINFSMFYAGKDSPKYTDQTKTRITTPNFILNKAFAKSALYSFFFHQAEKIYINHILKNGESDMYWPAISKEGSYKELIIAEGFSAISGIKAMRDPQTQACLALRGKILNVMQKSLKGAMKSEIINEILTVITHTKFDKIIIACDSDGSGNHICTLLLGLFSRFAPDLLHDGRIFYCNTPMYTFTKGKQLQFSDSSADCPSGQGWHTITNKGLGSLTSQQIKMFIADPTTRDILQFEYDNPLADERLEFVLIRGGVDWVQG